MEILQYYDLSLFLGDDCILETPIQYCFVWKVVLQICDGSANDRGWAPD